MHFFVHHSTKVFYLCQYVDSERVILSEKQKALSINLNQDLYGTFAEIGAGQEVVRHFFRAGGASGTIAKAISAYDKDFSDALYGTEKNGRYVCQHRLEKMLLHEYNLLEDLNCLLTFLNKIKIVHNDKVKDFFAK